MSKNAATITARIRAQSRYRSSPTPILRIANGIEMNVRAMARKSGPVRRNGGGGFITAISIPGNISKHSPGIAMNREETMKIHARTFTWVSQSLETDGGGVCVRFTEESWPHLLQNRSWKLISLPHCAHFMKAILFS